MPSTQPEMNDADRQTVERWIRTQGVEELRRAARAAAADQNSTFGRMVNAELLRRAAPAARRTA